MIREPYNLLYLMFSSNPSNCVEWWQTRKEKEGKYIYIATEYPLSKKSGKSSCHTSA